MVFSTTSIVSPQSLSNVPQALEAEDDPVFILTVEHCTILAGAVGAQVRLVLHDDGLG